MAIEYFPCYDSYFEKTRKLTDQELGRLFRALMLYHATGERQELAGREWMAFEFIADDIDRANKAYADKCKKMRENGKANASKSQQLPAIGSKVSQTKTKDKTKDNNNTPKRSEIPRTAYGEFGNVFLSDTELEKIKGLFPDWQQKIEALSAYMKSNGKSYKDHYATILNWARKDAEKQETPRFQRPERPGDVKGSGSIGSAELESLRQTLSQPVPEVPAFPWEENT